MISRSPKLYLKRKTDGPAFAKLQPSNSVIFTELPTTQQKQQKYVSDLKSTAVGNLPDPQRGSTG